MIEELTEVDERKEKVNWVTFWKRNDSSSESISRYNIEVFLRSTKELMQFHSGDIVLDVGCGYFHLGEKLKDIVKEVHCADISDFYLERGRKQFEGVENVKFHKLDEDNYTDLSVLGKGAFTKVICLSVVQYYRGIEEAERLILEVGKIAASGAKLLIADIPVLKPGFIEAFKTIVNAGLDGKFTDACLLFLRGMTGTYWKVSREVGLLTLSREQIKEMGERLKLKFQILEDQCTINPGRVHLLIEF
jgi:SAM-dependent methyltransferase